MGKKEKKKRPTGINYRKFTYLVIIFSAIIAVALTFHLISSGLIPLFTTSQMPVTASAILSLMVAGCCFCALAAMGYLFLLYLCERVKEKRAAAGIAFLGLAIAFAIMIALFIAIK